MDETALRTTAEAHANAYAAGDDATFASYMTPQALLALREATRAPVARNRRIEVRRAEARDGRGESEVAFGGATAQTLTCSWEARDGKWIAVAAKLDPPQAPRSWWRRMFNGRNAATSTAERKDLA